MRNDEECSLYQLFFCRKGTGYYIEKRYNCEYTSHNANQIHNSHSDRSMKSNNKIIVERTIKATEWIRNNIDLTVSELNKLYSHRNYFCGIHSYLDGDRIQAISFSIKAIFKGGLKGKYLTLLAKSIVGRKLILKYS